MKTARRHLPKLALAALLWAVAIGRPAEAGAASGNATEAPATNLPPGHVRGPAPAGGAGRDRSVIADTDRAWWSFRPLRPTQPPEIQPAAARTLIDRFVVARLQAKGLKPAPPADRRTLLRRASFDLLGLPPSPEDVERFAKDPRPDAWAREVRRLLDSPRYGERWARHWLDVARFAESSGFEHDYDRPHAYHFRDFVIRALNSDLPYDQFVRWQLAGDEYAPGDPLALMATGFLGAGVFPTQITANEVERTRYDAMDDMLATTGTAMLGLTIGCARCHDHKYDPIPSHDYYRMLATFTSTVRSEVDLDLDPEQTRRVSEAHAREHAPLTLALENYEHQELPAKFTAWLEAGAPRPAGANWEQLAPLQVGSRAGATFRKLEDGSWLAEGKNGDHDEYTFVTELRPGGPGSPGEIRALRLEALADASLPRGGPGRADNGNIGLSRIRLFASPLTGTDSGTNEVRLARARATFEQNTNHLSVSAALDDRPDTGWAVDPKFGTNHAAIFEFGEPLSRRDGVRLEVRLEFSVNTRHNIGRARLSVTGDGAAGLGEPALSPRLAELLGQVRAGRTATPGDAIRKLSESDRALLLGWWKTSEPGWRALADKVEAHARTAPRPKLTKVMICGEGHPAMRMHTQGADFFDQTYFLQRGSTDQKKGVALPGFLQVLMPAAANERKWQWEPPANARFSGRRRALAEWMTDVDQGAGALLARVMVNRLWQHHFGQGLVATPNDFGAQGAPPSHPELLDWLAAELIRHGWRLKPIHELILTSAVYQQAMPAGRALERAFALDPDNALLSRRIPARLEAEAVRDALLFVSGLLETNLYGPGTLDEGSHRRSVYLTVKRSRLVPAMQVFDAPEPLASQGARPSTTVAPQALLLMNSPQVRAWADAFASRCVEAGPHSDPAAAVDRAYALALNRQPTPDERADALRFIAAQERRNSAGTTDPGAISPGTYRHAIADLAQVILSLNEFIYVE